MPFFVAYGHFPLSVIAHPETDPWWLFASRKASPAATLKQVLLRHSVAAYLNGHLHSAFGQRLHRLHPGANGEVLSRATRVSDERFLVTSRPWPPSKCRLYKRLSRRACARSMSVLEAHFKAELSSAGRFLAELETAAWVNDRRARIVVVDDSLLAFSDLFLETRGLPPKPTTTAKVHAFGEQHYGIATLDPEHKVRPTAPANLGQGRGSAVHHPSSRIGPRKEKGKERLKKRAKQREQMHSATDSGKVQSSS